LRPLPDLPVYIEEDHHEVLPHIFKNIGAKHLPLEHNTLLHFDSHPDLLLPADLGPEEAFDKFKLFQKLSIENWILPGVFVGVFRTIVWVCPPWSNQIPPGEYSFQVGRSKETDRLAVSCWESYYLSEGLFLPREQMDNVKTVKLIVVKLGEDGENQADMEDRLLVVREQIAEVDHFILDIDLDFFSTLNPFVTLYSEAGLYDQLRPLYTFSCCLPADLEPGERASRAAELGNKRRLQLDQLASIWRHQTEEESLAGYCGPGDQLLPRVQAIVDSVRKHCPRQQVDWMLIHDAGCTFDESELPHHISSSSEVSRLLGQTERLLDWLDKPPTIVTVARSSCDDYCPPDQVESIQAGVLNLLRMKYRGVREVRCYQDPV